MLRGRPLFDELVALTGVEPVLASGAMTRALADGGVAIDDATASDYVAALPRLRARLKAYLPPDQAEERSQAILAHVTKMLGTAARVTTGGTTRSSVKAQLQDRVRGVSDSAKADGTPPPSGEPSWDDGAADITHSGRRWTADELAIARGGQKEKK